MHSAVRFFLNIFSFDFSPLLSFIDKFFSKITIISDYPERQQIIDVQNLNISFENG